MTVDQPELPTSRNASESVSDQLPAVLGGFDLTDQVRFSGGFPHEVFNRLRADEPILLHPPGRTRDGESFWVLSRYEDVVEAAANPVFSSQGGEAGKAAAPTSTTSRRAPTPAGCST
ncbi:hypothetical protein ACFQ0O_20550 [Saccharopolyspora spinosporotrichia]